MIETAAIVWAVATSGVAIFSMHYAVKEARRRDDAEYRLWILKTDKAQWEQHARKAWAELDGIKLQRHKSARYARKCQLDQYLARQRETTEKLKAGVGR